MASFGCQDTSSSSNINGYGRGRVRPYVLRVIKSEVKNKIINLLEHHGEVPIISFPLLYYYRYNEMFDVSEYDFDDGWKGFFEFLSDSVILEKNSRGVLVCRPRFNNSKMIESFQQNDDVEFSSLNEKNQVANLSQNVMKKQNNVILDHIFQQDNTILWNDTWVKLLDLSYIIIEPSPLELVMLHRYHEMMVEKEKIKKVLSKFPKGVPVSSLCRYISLDKRLLSVTSIDSATVEYPELFYRYESECNEDETIVFDGTCNTIEDLDGNNINPFKHDSPEIVISSILSGIYQKTLILMRESEPDGLKLATWKRSLTECGNFSISGDPHHEEVILKLDPVFFFRILAHYKLIKIKSHPSSMNDLRLHFYEEKVDYASLLEQLNKEKEQVEERKKYDRFQMEERERILQFINETI